MTDNKTGLLIATFDLALHPDTPTHAFAEWLRFYVQECEDGSKLRSCALTTTTNAETSGLTSQN